MRVFGALLSDSEQVAAQSRKKGTPKSTVIVQELSTANEQANAQIEVMQAKLDAANQLLALKDEIIEEKDKRLALLEHKPNMSENLAPNSPPDTGSVYSENTDKDFKRERKKEGRLIKLGRFLFDE
jgi:hypothetical protein